MQERTLSIIKPDATERNITGLVNSMIEAARLKIIAQKMIRLTQEQAQEFYEELKDKAFFAGMTAQMSSSWRMPSSVTLTSRWRTIW